MAMPAPTTEWTLEMLHALPDDGKRYELVDGELLVSPAPELAHQWLVADLQVLLRAFARTAGGMDAVTAPVAITFSHQRELQPDIVVLPLVSGRRPQHFSETGRAVLVVEVLSPSTARFDRVTKRRVYQEHGVPEYWIVDPEARLVERWRPEDERPEVTTTTLSWTPPGSDQHFTIDLDALFRDATGTRADRRDR